MAAYNIVTHLIGLSEKKAYTHSSSEPFCLTWFLAEATPFMLFCAHQTIYIFLFFSVGVVVFCHILVCTLCSHIIKEKCTRTRTKPPSLDHIICVMFSMGLGGG